jgi:WD40 repeat protein
MYVWDLATGKIIRTLRPPGNIGGDGKIAVSPDGGFVAVVNGDGHAYVWDLTTGKLVATFADPGSKGADGVAFSPDGSFLATGDLNGSTYLWNMNWLG